MKKCNKVLALLLAAVLFVGMLPGNVFAEEMDMAVGAWQVNPDAKAVKLPTAVQKAFNEAKAEMQQDGAYMIKDAIPLAYYSKQVVAGMNYGVICKVTTNLMPSAAYLANVTIYAPLEGTAHVDLTNIRSIDLGAYSTAKRSTAVNTEVIDGGWAYAEDYTTGDIPKDAQEVFDKAVANLNIVGVSYQPTAFLGSQVVAGVNMAYLCQVKPVVADPGTGTTQIVFVYYDTEGNATITNTYPLDPNPNTGIENQMTAKAKTVTAKAATLKKKNVTIKASKAFTVKNSVGAVSYKKVKGDKKITVAKNGNVTLKKNLKKGTYKVKVKITDSGNITYEAGSKKVTLTVKVK